MEPNAEPSAEPSALGTADVSGAKGESDASGASGVSGASEVAGGAGANRVPAVNGLSAVNGASTALLAASARPGRSPRRFPRFTKDTARPEGGGRAAPGDAPAPARQWPMLVVLCAVAFGLLLIAFDVSRVGMLLIGAAMLAGAVMRVILPSVGMLAVRSRFTDIATYGTLGLAIVLLALMAQPSPWLQMPFLKDILHFTLAK